MLPCVNVDVKVESSALWDGGGGMVLTAAPGAPGAPTSPSLPAAPCRGQTTRLISNRNALQCTFHRHGISNTISDEMWSVGDGYKMRYTYSWAKGSSLAS